MHPQLGFKRWGPVGDDKEGNLKKRQKKKKKLKFKLTIGEI
jgi:hypothetical protein